MLLAVIAVPLLSSLVIELPAPGLPARPRLLAAPMVAHSSLRPIPGISLRGVTQPWRVGVQVGHLDIEALPDEQTRLRTSTGAEWGSIREVDINPTIARLVVEELEAGGIVVDLLPARVPPRYDADAIVSIHADGAWREARGWKVAAPHRGSPASRQLRDAIAASYATETGLPHDYAGVTHGMRGHFAFSPHRYLHAAAWTTPATIVETGFVTQADDRRFLLEQPEVAARGIADGVRHYLADRDPSAAMEVVPSWFPAMRVRVAAPLRQLPDPDEPGGGAALPGGTRVYPLERTDGWYHVLLRLPAEDDEERGQTRYGWLPADTLERY